MGILAQLKDFIRETKGWEVNTKYEFYRNFLRDNKINITDYDYIYSLEKYLSSSKSFDETSDIELLSITDNMIIKKNHKKKLKELYKKCKVDMETIESLDVRLLTDGSEKENLPTVIEDYITRCDDKTKSIEDSIKDCYNLHLRRYRQLDKILNNYNRKTLIREFYYTENDIEYILTKILNAPRDIAVKDNLESFNRLAITPSTNRVLIAVVLFLLEREELANYMDRPLSQYLNRRRVLNLKEFLSKLIS